MLQGEKGYYIVQVASRKAPYLPALKEIEAEVEKQYREAEAKRLAKKEADDLIARLKKGGDLEGVAGEKGLKVSETGLFQPGGAVPKLGSSVELTEALFQISEKKPYPEQAYWVDGNYVILKFKARGKVDDAEFVAQKDAIVNYLARTKKQRRSRPGSREARPPWSKTAVWSSQEISKICKPPIRKATAMIAQPPTIMP